MSQNRPQREDVEWIFKSKKESRRGHSLVERNGVCANRDSIVKGGVSGGPDVPVPVPPRAKVPSSLRHCTRSAVACWTVGWQTCSQAHARTPGRVSIGSGACVGGVLCVAGPGRWGVGAVHSTPANEHSDSKHREQ